MEKTRATAYTGEWNHTISQSAVLEPFSYSRISTFEKCPKSYEYKYVLGLSEEFESIERFMGHIVHLTLRWAMEARDGQVAHTTDVLDMYRRLWQEHLGPSVKVIKRGKSPSEYLDSGEQMLRFYSDRLNESWNDEVLALEAPFTFEIDEVPTIPYTGVIDRIARKRDGSIEITDYKTGSSRDKDAHLRQIKSYAPHVFAEYPSSSVQLNLEYLREDATVKVSYTVEEAKTDILPVITNRVRTINRTTIFDRRESALCRWCGYNSICEQDRREDDDEDICPRCGGVLQERNGRYGPFIGCSNYPRCKYTRDEW